MAALLTDAADALHATGSQAAVALLREARAVVVCPPAPPGGQPVYDGWDGLAQDVAGVIFRAGMHSTLVGLTDDPGQATVSRDTATRLVRATVDELVRDDGQAPDIDAATAGI